MAKGNPKYGRKTVRKTSPKRGVKKINAIKKTVDGIEFDSMLEVFTYKKLKENNLGGMYEPKSFTILPGFTYEGETHENRGKADDLVVKDSSTIRAITYTPDFVKYNDNGDIEWIIECKGFANERFPNVWKMFKFMLMQTHDVPPMLFMPRNQKQVLSIIERLKS